MSTQKQKDKKIHVDSTVHKGTVAGRIDAGGKVTTTAPKSSVYQGNTVVKQTADAVTAATTDLQTANGSVVTAEAALTAARATRDAKLLTFDNTYDVFATTVEANVTTPQDVTGLGAVLATRTLHPLEPPIGIKVAYDANRSRIVVHVEAAPGLHQIALEVSVDPPTATSWQRLEGYGRVRSLAGYAPGTYWFHAASMRKDQRSPFTSAVSVVVK
jgi:hypothetical protein